MNEYTSLRNAISALRNVIERTSHLPDAAPIFMFGGKRHSIALFGMTPVDSDPCGQFADYVTFSLAEALDAAEGLLPEEDYGTTGGSAGVVAGTASRAA